MLKNRFQKRKLHQRRNRLRFKKETPSLRGRFCLKKWHITVPALKTNFFISDADNFNLLFCISINSKKIVVSGPMSFLTTLTFTSRDIIMPFLYPSQDAISLYFFPPLVLTQRSWSILLRVEGSEKSCLTELLQEHHHTLT